MSDTEGYDNDYAGAIIDDSVQQFSLPRDFSSSTNIYLSGIKSVQQLRAHMEGDRPLSAYEKRQSFLELTPEDIFYILLSNASRKKFFSKYSKYVDSILRQLPLIPRLKYVNPELILLAYAYIKGNDGERKSVLSSIKEEKYSKLDILRYVKFIQNYTQLK